jgi:hypothetical protein
MTTSSRALVLAGMMGALLVVALVVVLLVRGLDGPALAGLGIGGALGAVNLAAGGLLLAFTLRRRPKAALAVSLGGFFVRLGVLLGLTYGFSTVEAVDEITFAVSFVVFFFLFLVVEIGIVSRASKRPAGTGATR